MTAAERDWRKLRAKIMAWQRADERHGLNEPWAPGNVLHTQQRFNRDYEAWCAANGREPIWQWVSTVIATIGTARIEIKGAAGDGPLDRWLGTFRPGYKPPRGPSPYVPDARYNFAA